jgi:hypothetical protein
MTNKIKVLAIGLFLASMVFAKSEQQPGEPPFGMAVQGDAKGTKLSGALFAEFHNCIPDGNVPPRILCQARIVLRLRKGSTNEFATFYGDTGGLASIPLENVAAAQQLVINLMAPQVIDHFFGNANFIYTDDPSLTIKLKSVTEYGFIDGTATDLTDNSQIVLTDLQIAVN